MRFVEIWLSSVFRVVLNCLWMLDLNPMPWLRPSAAFRLS